MENIIIRNMNKEDIPRVVDIQIDGWKTAYKDIVDDEYLNMLNKDERIKKIEKSYLKYDFIVAECQGDIVGFANYIDNNDFTSEIQVADCELSAIYVEPDLKYNGIGTKLFEHVRKELMRKNKSKMVLWCLKDNEPSKKFYEKMGGEIIGERLIKIGKREHMEVCFSYNITQPLS